MTMWKNWIFASPQTFFFLNIRSLNSETYSLRVWNSFRNSAVPLKVFILTWSTSKNEFINFWYKMKNVSNCQRLKFVEIYFVDAFFPATEIVGNLWWYTKVQFQRMFRFAGNEILTLLSVIQRKLFIIIIIIKVCCWENQRQLLVDYFDNELMV